MSAPAAIYLEPGSYRYNAALGESQRLAFTQCVATEVIERWLEALPDSANSDDIYARLRVSGNPPRNPRRETDFARQRQLMRQFEKLVLDTEAHEIFLLWRYRIVPYRSYVKGWKASPSHYVNQNLATIGLDK